MEFHENAQTDRADSRPKTRLDEYYDVNENWILQSENAVILLSYRPGQRTRKIASCATHLKKAADLQ